MNGYDAGPVLEGFEVHGDDYGGTWLTHRSGGCRWCEEWNPTPFPAPRPAPRNAHPTLAQLVTAALEHAADEHPEAVNHAE